MCERIVEGLLTSSKAGWLASLWQLDGGKSHITACIIRYNLSMTLTIKDEMKAYISVDVETAGAIPSQFALLSIGACTLGEPRKKFYVELQPDREEFDAGAMNIHRLDAEALRREGLPPAEAMTRFADWLKTTVPEGQRPLFCAFNAPFDWSFVNDYFIRYTGDNPFGHSAIDIKAVFMGVAHQPWKHTSMSYLSERNPDVGPLTHNALQDAIDQAVIFEGILAEIGEV